MSGIRNLRPVWFLIVAILLLLWATLGCIACLRQLQLGAEVMGPSDAGYRQLYAALPRWYNICYAIGVGTGLLGAVCLLFRSAAARPFYTVSLVAVVIQFGYTFAETDMIAVKGVGSVAFPMLIAAIGAFALWLATHARRRGWIG